MKKVLALALALVLVLSLAACGGGKDRADSIKDIYSISYFKTDYDRIVISFEKGTLIVEYIKYTDDANSPSGKIMSSSRKETYDYTFEGDNHIIADGKDYEYTIYSSLGNIVFKDDFLGITKTWTIYVLKS